MVTIGRYAGAALVARAMSTYFVLPSLHRLPSAWSYLKIKGLPSVKEKAGIHNKQRESEMVRSPNISCSALFNSLLSYLLLKKSCLSELKKLFCCGKICLPRL